jgi:hypothetical protein
MATSAARTCVGIVVDCPSSTLCVLWNNDLCFHLPSCIIIIVVKMNFLREASLLCCSSVLPKGFPFCKFFAMLSCSLMGFSWQVTRCWIYLVAKWIFVTYYRFRSVPPSNCYLRFAFDEGPNEIAFETEKVKDCGILLSLLFF